LKLRGLYAVTPDNIDGNRLVCAVQEVLEGRPALLQYRRKKRDIAEAREIVALARRYEVPVIVNDDVELALEVQAAGAHLGRDDGDLPAARKRLGGKILGTSCYDDPHLARAAVRAGADYVAFGSVYPSPTKPHALRAPLSLFSSALGVPLCAIGGITVENSKALIEAGADLLAVITDLFEAPDIARRAAQYRELFA
jgi:thiamine-phosphate pyrophosphorylase